MLVATGDVFVSGDDECWCRLWCNYYIIYVEDHDGVYNKFEGYTKLR